MVSNFKKSKNMKDKIQYIKQKFFYICVILTAFFASCGNPEDFFSPVIDVTLPPHVPRLVVRADWESNTDSVAVFVCKSRGALDNTPYNYQSAFDTVANTKVEVFKNGQLIGTIPYTYGGYHIAKGLFTLDTLGSSYTLRISAPNFETIEATQQTMRLPNATNFSYRLNAAVLPDPLGGGGGERVDEIAFDIQDIGSEQNYYDATSLSLGYRDTTGRFWTQNITHTSLDNLTEDNILPDNTFNGRAYRWRLGNEGTWDFCYSENGRTVCRRPRTGDRFSMTLRSVSRDWFLFRKSRNLLRDAQDNIFFSEPVILHTNIKNGYGVFTIYSRKRITFTLP